MPAPSAAEALAVARPDRSSSGEVLWFACTLSMITYLDRVCFGAAVPFLVRDLGLTDVADLKWAFTAFTIGYALFEMPSGWLGDTRGARETLVRIVLGWSLFTALTGLVGVKVGGIVLGGVGTLCAIRFLFGMGEAGAYPNLARVVADWFPPRERGRAKGAIWMAGRFMGGLTPLVWTILVAGTIYFPPLTSWRGAFILFGLVGVLWCIAFSTRYRDPPQQAEDRPVAAPPHPFPWRAILADRNLWYLGLMYAACAYSWYFNITYFPSFLETRYGVDRGSLGGAVMKGAPLLLGGFGCLIGGYWTDSLLTVLPKRRWARRIPAMFGHGLCSICYLLAVIAHSAWAVALAISLAAFAADLMMGAAWATCQDVGRRHTAVVAGWMNMLGNLGGAVSGWTIGTILELATAAHAAAEGNVVARISASAHHEALSEGYELCLFSFAAVSLAAMLLWLGINSEKTLEAGS